MTRTTDPDSDDPLDSAVYSEVTRLVADSVENAIDELVEPDDVDADDGRRVADLTRGRAGDDE